MHLDALKYFYDLTAADYAAFCYRGPFADRFTNSILDIAITRKDDSRMLPNIQRKVSFMLVECFQNILKHAESLPSKNDVWKDDGMFGFRDSGKAFVIDSLNLIQANDAERLSGLVNRVNQLEGEELKQFYLHHLRENELSAKSGAGLGLIELARKSGQKILHKTTVINSSFALFQQQVAMLRDTESERNPERELKRSESVYHKLKDDDVFVFYKGEFSQKSILSLLDLVEHNAAKQSYNFTKKKRAGHVLIEVLQNISKYHDSANSTNPNSGIFMVGQHEEGLFIVAGNEVSLSEKVFLEEKLDYLTTLNEDELKDLHRLAMKASLRFESKTKSGLGLIEVVKAGSDRIDYKFFQTSKDKFLFTVNVKV